MNCLWGTQLDAILMRDPSKVVFRCWMDWINLEDRSLWTFQKLDVISDQFNVQAQDWPWNRLGKVERVGQNWMMGRIFSRLYWSSQETFDQASTSASTWPVEICSQPMYQRVAWNILSSPYFLKSGLWSISCQNQRNMLMAIGQTVFLVHAKYTVHPSLLDHVYTS